MFFINVFWPYSMVTPIFVRIAMSVSFTTSSWSCRRKRKKIKNRPFIILSKKFVTLQSE